MAQRQNLTYNESKILRELLENSRKTNGEIAKDTGLSRNTVTRTINSLISRGVIKNFTVNIEPVRNDLMIIATVKDLSDVPERFIIEAYELADGTYMVVLEEDVLRHKFESLDLKVSHRRIRKTENISDIKLYCDYCKKEINETPYRLEKNKTMYYLCCPTCTKAMNSRLKASD